LVAAGQDAGPLVTVAIATYNCSDMLRWTLESVRNQDLANFEAWVVGDACSDDSGEVVAALGDPRFRWRNRERRSGSQTMPDNYALRLARGRYVAYLGHDDLWLPWHLSSLVRAAEETRSDLVHSLCGVIGPAGALEATGPPKPGVTYETHFVPPSSWLHRSELREECGLWEDSDRLPLAVDREYLRRLHRAGKHIAFFPRLTVLKFPSMWWGHYRSGSDRPQRAYLEAMRTNPDRVEHEVLRELSIEFSRERHGGDESWIRPLKRSLRLVGKRLLARWGTERWPLPLLMRWHYQRYRRRIRRARGLDSIGPPKIARSLDQ
jgi:glycosyltransferase involved in cell wall biosynthesis